MKRSELLFSFLLIPVDYIMIVLSGISVYYIRYNTFLAELRPPVFEINIIPYLKIVLLVGILWLPLFAIARMYNIQKVPKFIDEFSRVALGCSAGLVLIVMAIFFRHELFGSRFLVLAGYGASIIFVFIGRVIIRLIQRTCYKRKIGVWRTIIIGQDVSAKILEDELRRDLSSGYSVVRHFKKIDDASFGMLENVAKKGVADIVILADHNHGRREILRLYRFCQENHIDFSYAADVLEAKKSNVETGELCGTPIVHIKRTSLDGWGRIVKRAIDIVFSAIALVFLAPIFFICGLIIKADSKGPIFVRLERMGDEGKSFKLYKFRSMVKDAHKMKDKLEDKNERGGPLFKMRQDPRITRFGKFLRKWSIDELPNFINVVKGDISLVGPRPHEPGEVVKYYGFQKRLLNIKPGVTGLAQISGRSDLSFDEEARLDLFYIENWNIWLDISILLRTPWVVLRGKSAV